MSLPAGDVEVREIIQDLVKALSKVHPNHRALTRALNWLSQSKKEARRHEKLPARVSTASCNTCGQPIFFALRAPRKWTPLVPVPINIQERVMDAVVVDFSNPNGPSITNEFGTQWFIHWAICGMEERPKDGLLATVWDQVMPNEDKAVVSLLRILEDS